MRTIKDGEKFKAFRKRTQWIYVSCPATWARVFPTSPQLVALSIASNFRGNCGQYLIGRGTKFDDTWLMLDREVGGIQRTWLKWGSDNVLSCELKILILIFAYSLFYIYTHYYIFCYIIIFLSYFYYILCLLGKIIEIYFL